MAEEKKPSQKTDLFEELVFIFFGLFILGTLITRFMAFVKSGDYSGGIFGALGDFYAGDLLPTLKLISLIVSSLSIVGITYSLVKLTAINKKLNVTYNPLVKPSAPITKEEDVTIKSNKWQRVMEHMASDNSNDWRLAILEADIILEEFLDLSGYRGETVSEKLKRVERSDFETVELAWEAHKVRNQIAHNGADFVLSRKEAERVIGLYQKVFEEFYYI